MSFFSESVYRCKLPPIAGHQIIVPEEEVKIILLEFINNENIHVYKWQPCIYYIYYNKALEEI